LKRIGRLEHLVLPEDRRQFDPTAKFELQPFQNAHRQRTLAADVARRGNEDSKPRQQCHRSTGCP
jgi:hypothetical protein